jgi:hypothetical protein
VADVLYVELSPLLILIEGEVGAVLSIIIALFALNEPDEPGEGRVNVASWFRLSLIVPLFNERESVAL